MKTTSTLTKKLKQFFFIFILSFPFVSIAQPDYDFRDAILISGTDLQAGAVYRFNNVRTGVDAFVTLNFISPGIALADLDAGSGYPEALQPTLLVDPGANGYVEMKLDFLIAGTNTPFIQTRVPVTCIDVDGISNNDGLGNGIFEFDELDLGGGYMNYDLLATELQVTQSGNIFRGYNMAGIDYPGRDTSARQVMFTAVNHNIASCIIRVGVDNHSTVSATRLRSVYFKEFWYNNGLLPLFGLISFNGTQKENGTDLRWELAAECSFSGITIERSVDGKKFSAVTYKNVSFSSQIQKMNYLDMTPSDAVVYYRLKLHYPNGKYNYSEVLIMKSKTSSVQGFKVYPNLVESGASIMMSVKQKEAADLMIVDMNGRVMSRQQTVLSAGNNSIQLNGTDRLASGNYLVVLTMGNEKMTQKIIKR